MIPIEKIKYEPVAPWPDTPNVNGDAIYRVDVNTYGRDYSNWLATLPTPGS